MRSTPQRAALVAAIVLAGSLAARGDGDLATVARMTLADFKKDVDQDKVLAIDVRALESYRAGHIPGAINVPLSAWAEHLSRLKASSKPIVAYCS
jgi:3-mercaptopyruvate sulfurtransferase SseA